MSQLVVMLAERARAEGPQPTGRGGLLRQLTMRVLEPALEGEIADHLGYERHDAAARGSGDALLVVGPVEVKVSSDTSGTVEPRNVRKRQRGLIRVDEMVLSLSAKGLRHRETPVHLADVSGVEVGRQTVSTIIDEVVQCMAEWQSWSLARDYPVLFGDLINVKIWDGQVAYRPVYVVMAVTVDGTRDIHDIRDIWAPS